MSLMARETRFWGMEGLLLKHGINEKQMLGAELFWVWDHKRDSCRTERVDLQDGVFGIGGGH